MNIAQETNSYIDRLVNMYVILLLRAVGESIFASIVALVGVGIFNGTVQDLLGVSMGVYMLRMIFVHKRIFVSKGPVLSNIYYWSKYQHKLEGRGEGFSWFLILLPILVVIGLSIFGIRVF